MSKKGKKLNQIVKRTASQWKARAKSDRANRKQITRSQKFALELLGHLDENGIKQKELAELMGVSPQQVSKILRAKANLTFETLDKIEEALGVTITSPQIKSRQIHSPIITNVMKVVHTINFEQGNEDLLSPGISEKNPMLETTIESMAPYRFTADQI